MFNVHSFRSEEPLCESMMSVEQAVPSVRFGSVVLVKARRHLALWDQYVDFICNIDASDLDDLLTQAMEEFGWPEDVAEVRALSWLIYFKIYLRSKLLLWDF